MACLGQNLGDIKERLERLESPLPVYFMEFIRLGLQWKKLEIEDSISHLASLSSSIMRFRNYLVNWGYMAGIGIRIIFIYSWGCG